MTFGEAPAAAKHRVSHRGRAVRALVEVLLRRSA
jgi:inosine/xanthosine triphosphate pyrophosphatase family protein